MNNEHDDLNEWLNTEMAPSAPPDLQASILADFDAVTQRRSKGASDLAGFFGWKRKGLGRFLPGGALAGLSALGFMAGAVSANASDAGMNDDVYTYWSDALDATLENEEAGLWDVE